MCCDIRGHRRQPDSAAPTSVEEFGDLTTIAVNAEGQIVADGEVVGKVLITGAGEDGTTRVRSGALEGSNVSAVETMVSMITAARQFEAQMKMQKEQELTQLITQMMKQMHEMSMFLTPAARRSAIVLRLKPMAACLEAAYGPAGANATVPATETTLTTCAPRCSPASSARVIQTPPR